MMIVCIVFNPKYSNPEASVSRTIGRDAQQAVKHLRIYSCPTTMAKRASPLPHSQVTYNISPKNASV